MLKLANDNDSDSDNYKHDDNEKNNDYKKDYDDDYANSWETWAWRTKQSFNRFLSQIRSIES